MGGPPDSAALAGAGVGVGKGVAVGAGVGLGATVAVGTGVLCAKTGWLSNKKAAITARNGKNSRHDSKLLALFCSIFGSKHQITQ